MTISDIASCRLQNQYITSNKFETPKAMVSRMGAVQAQDYLGALWAIGLRMRQATQIVIEQAIAEKTIVRTWPMRGTLHFVAAPDVRWLLHLMAPRVIATSAFRYHQLELDQYTLMKSQLMKSQQVLVRTLEGGKQLTRAELASALEQSGISTAGQRLSHLLARAEIDALICYGTRRGKQVTFTLLDEWVPVTKFMEREQALAELTRRYFTSHGPATLQDYIWWSGLTAADARAGIQINTRHLVQETIEGHTFYFSSAHVITTDTQPFSCFLPPFDEYLVGYKNRSAALDLSYANRLSNLLSPTVVMDGRIVGTWKRYLKKNTADITVSPFQKWSKPDQSRVIAAAESYAAFLGIQLGRLAIIDS